MSKDIFDSTIIAKEQFLTQSDRKKMVENSFSLTKIFRLKTLIPQIPEKYGYNVDIRL